MKYCVSLEKHTFSETVFKSSRLLSWLPSFITSEMKHSFSFMKIKTYHNSPITGQVSPVSQYFSNFTRFILDSRFLLKQITSEIATCVLWLLGRGCTLFERSSNILTVESYISGRERRTLFSIGQCCSYCYRRDTFREDVWKECVPNYRSRTQSPSSNHADFKPSNIALSSFICGQHSNHLAELAF